MKTCVACGMPMTKSTDFPLGDESKDYCVYCARPDGSMQSYPRPARWRSVHWRSSPRGRTERTGDPRV